ncbi:MAG TPA: MmcQ/YjbR family DNA-binding protein [Planctomycetota bacterium]|nr:MmcQ/YjbR family DNA-binding protein [Planctomycetota bacterium]
MSRLRATRSVIERRKARLTRCALALPEVERSDVGDHIGYSLKATRFAWILDDHHGDGRVALHAKGERGANSALAEVHPDRYHLPKYVAKQGWIGLWLDLPDCDPAEAEALIRDAWRLAAPKRLLREADAAGSKKASRRTTRGR